MQTFAGTFPKSANVTILYQIFHKDKMNCHSLLNDSSFCFERQFIFFKRINGNFRTTDLQYRELHLL